MGGGGRHTGMCLRGKRRKKEVDRHVRAFLRRCQKGGQRKAIVSVHKFTNSQLSLLGTEVLLSGSSLCCSTARRRLVHLFYFLCVSVLPGQTVDSFWEMQDSVICFLFGNCDQTCWQQKDRQVWRSRNNHQLFKNRTNKPVEIFLRHFATLNRYWTTVLL